MPDQKNNQEQSEGNSRDRRNDTQEVREDMDVVGRDGTYIGRVIEVRDLDFLVDRSHAHDIYVPFDACQSVANEVTLNILASEVDEQGWSSPERVESPIIQDDLESE